LYVLNGKIYSFEESIHTPATNKPCVYFEYKTNAFKGRHSTKLYLLTPDGTKLELYSRYNVKDFPKNIYNYSDNSMYYINLKTYLHNSGYDLPEFFASLPKDLLERQNAITDLNKNLGEERKRVSSSIKDFVKVSSSLAKIFKPIFTEEFYSGPFAKDFDTDQFLPNTYLYDENSDIYMLKNNFFDDTNIEEIALEPGQDVTVVCFKDKNNNYAVGNFKFYENISLYPGLNYDVKKSLYSKFPQKIMVIIFILFFIGVAFFLLTM